MTKTGYITNLIKSQPRLVSLLFTGSLILSQGVVSIFNATAPNSGP